MATMTRYELGRRLAALVPVAHERAVKGAELAATGKVHKLVGYLWAVDGTDTYIVDVAAGTCDCPDGRAPHDEQGRKFCKHMCAVLLNQ
jgi:uncharacterized Zn finger protein